jgi:hypothetical protein
MWNQASKDLVIVQRRISRMNRAKDNTIGLNFGSVLRRLIQLSLQELIGDDIERISFPFFKQLSIKTRHAWAQLAVGSEERKEMGLHYLPKLLSHDHDRSRNQELLPLSFPLALPISLVITAVRNFRFQTAVAQT